MKTILFYIFISFFLIGQSKTNLQSNSDMLLNIGKYYIDDTLKDEYQDFGKNNTNTEKSSNISNSVKSNKKNINNFKVEKSTDTITQSVNQTKKTTNNNRATAIKTIEYKVYFILLFIVLFAIFLYYYSYTSNKYQDLKKKKDELEFKNIKHLKTIGNLRQDVTTLKRKKTIAINKLDKQVETLKKEKSILNKKSNAFENELNSLLTFFKTKPVNAEYYNNIGNEFLNNENYIEAIKNFTRAIDIEPNDAEYYYNRGYSYYQLGDYNNEINDYSKAIEINPNNAEYYESRDLSFYQLKDYNNAIQDFTKAIEINPNEDSYYNDRGRSFYQLDDYNNAIQDLTKAIEIEPNDAALYNNRGRSFYQLEKYKDTIKDFSKAIEIEPNNKQYYYWRGRAFYKLENYNTAIKDFSKAIEIKPNEDSYYHLRAHNYKELGKWKESIKDFQTAININPKTGWHQECLGKLYLELKEYENAKKYFLKATELNPNDDDYRKSLKDVNEIISGRIQSKLENSNHSLLNVNYTSSIIEKTAMFPIFKLPKNGCIIKTHKYGKSQRRGYKEKDFQSLIERYFSNGYEISGEIILLTGKHTNPYEPDIAIIGKNNNIRIDIEIDEPYAGITRQATHCKGDDDNRDSYFTDRGWIVIRFSEYQVHKNPKECLKYIATNIASIDDTFSMPTLFENTNSIHNNEIWDLVMAQKMEKARFREEYLGIINFGNQEPIPNKAIELTEDDKVREEAEENEVNSTSYGNIYNPTNNSKDNNRNNRLKFYPEKHIYTIDGKPVPSVSTVIKKFFNEFDKIKAAENLNPNHPLYGLPVPEIIKIWDEKGRKSREKGTYLHQQIENYYLNKPYDDTDVFYQFLNFANEHQHLKIYKTEWRIFSEEFDVAGTIDLLVKNDNGTYDIYDWKRSKKIVDINGDIDRNNYRKYGIGNLEHLEDISYNQYALQQNLYRHILETKYNKKIENMYLIVMSGDEDFKTYVKVPIKRMKEETEFILKSLKK